jgi:hypothetical protein
MEAEEKWFNNGGVICTGYTSTDERICVVGEPNNQTEKDTEIARHICWLHNTQNPLEGDLAPFEFVFCAACDHHFYIERSFLSDVPCDVYCPYCKACVLGVAKHPKNVIK